MPHGNMTMIDWDKVNVLRDEVGEEDFDEVVELFLDEVEEALATLGQSDRSLEHDMHFLKGSALNLGFVAFSDLCRNAEDAASSGQADGVDVGEVIQSYHQSKKVFLSDMQMKLAG